ncbi:MAG: hypothetical protein N5P05_000003 [Chroococcopsis gigantea SAG 12.99]|jgi:hypothetical protein|nr:hypothetical protein [Chroococcopsis gigantea SAG 12.99]
MGFENIRERVQEFILCTYFDCLVADTFPRGLEGELAHILPSLSIPKILVHRDINLKYIQSKNLTQFARSVFDLIIIPGDGITSPLAYLHNVKRTPPWLIRMAHELPTLERAYFILKITPGESKTKLIIILASGRTDELVYYEELARSIMQKQGHIVLRFLSPLQPLSFIHDIWVSHYPAIEGLAAADLVIGGGGYNTVYECQALQVPLVAIPFPRLYDRQASRIARLITSYETPSKKIYLAGSSENILHRINSCISRTPKRKISFINGLTEAVAKINELLLSSLPLKSRQDQTE